MSLESAKKRRAKAHERANAAEKHLDDLLEARKRGETGLKVRIKRARVRFDRRERLYTKARRAVRKLRRQTHGAFEPWMANGYPYESLSAGCEAFIVRGVDAGLHVTSTKRNWGGNSFHEVWKAVDMAAGWDTMVAFQRREFTERPGGFYLELLGPTNSQMLKNNQPWTAAEGSYLEDLHDSHVHGAFN